MRVNILQVKPVSYASGCVAPEAARGGGHVLASVFEKLRPPASAFYKNRSSAVRARLQATTLTLALAAVDTRRIDRRARAQGKINIYDRASVCVCQRARVLANYLASAPAPQTGQESSLRTLA